MASRHRDPDWRDEAAGSLLLRHLPHASVRGPVLVMAEPRGKTRDALGEVGLEVVSWNRLALGGADASTWPPPGPFGAVMLRLPRSRDSLDMYLHAAAGAMDDGGSVLVYGAKDEGIASAAGHMEPLFSGVETVGVGGRCRVLRGGWEGGSTKPRTPLEAWKKIWEPGYPDLPVPWVSYPGVFAHGQLDAGTRLLLDSLPDIGAGWSVLDYGCGSGVVGAVVVSRQPEAEVHLLDVDAIALHAARENLPGARYILADGFSGVPSGVFDAVVTNPPFHRGKVEDPGMLSTMIRGSGRVLKPGGSLTLVTQRRMGVEGDLEKVFREVSERARDRVFSVWQGSRPR